MSAQNNQAGKQTIGGLLDSLFDDNSADLEKQAQAELEDKQVAAQIIFEHAARNGEDLSDLDFGQVEHETLIKTANAIIEDQLQTAMQIIAEEAQRTGEDLSDVDFSQIDPDQLLKTAGAIIDSHSSEQGEQDASAEEGEVQQLQLTPRLEARFAENPEAMQKFASLHPDQQMMIVHGDLLGTSAAAAFNAGIQKTASDEGGGDKPTRPISRFMSNPMAMGATGAGLGALSGLAFPGSAGRTISALGNAAVLGGLLAGGSAIARTVGGRGMEGRVNKGGAGLFAAERRALKNHAEREVTASLQTDEQDAQARQAAYAYLVQNGLWKEASAEQEQPTENPVVDLANAYIHDYLTQTNQLDRFQS